LAEIEDHIRKAQEEGKFSDLPGKGKPLHLDEDPFEDPEWRLAHRMLRNSGYTLPWIEQRQQIFALIEAVRENFRRAWEWRQDAIREHRLNAQAEAEWRRAKRAFGEQVNVINKSISDYNLAAPSERFQLAPLKVEREVEKLQDVRADEGEGQTSGDPL